MQHASAARMHAMRKAHDDQPAARGRWCASRKMTRMVLNLAAYRFVAIDDPDALARDLRGWAPKE